MWDRENSRRIQGRKSRLIYFICWKRKKLKRRGEKMVGDSEKEKSRMLFS